MLASVIRLLDRLLAILALVGLSLLLVVVMLGVISRGVGEPFIWSDEVSRFLMVWVSVLGWMLATRRRAHIRIRFFLDRMPGPSRRGAEALLQGAILLFGVLVAWHAWHLVGRNWEIEATTVPISMSWMYMPLVFAGLVTALQGASELWALRLGPPAVASTPVGAMEGVE